ncbi:MAG: deoxyhypusine synthase [Methanosarcinales archaeon]|nr:MAG: deoxyhypusine synthase [Methanosarcinales archaeon]
MNTEHSNPVHSSGTQLNDPVIQAKIVSAMSIDDLVSALGGCGFGAGRLAQACDIYEEMLKSGTTTKFFGLAGAMVPAGMRNIVSGLIRDGHIDALVSTGANLVHDLIESLGLPHYKGNDVVDDNALYREQIDRIYDVFIPELHFTRLEEHLLTVFEGMGDRISIRQMLSDIGKSLNDPNSILRAAYECNVPIFCPAVQDSMIGLHAWLYRQTNQLNIDVFADVHEFLDICFDAEQSGAVFIGGGVPKNFILQGTLMTSKGFDYAIQLTTDRPESGGLSGATLDEAKSWGKINENAKAVTVYADATITLPILVSAVRSRL